MKDTEIWSRIGRHLAGESSPAEDAELERWAAEDPSHAALLAAARRVWAAAGGHLPGRDSGAAWKRLAPFLSGESGASRGGAPPVAKGEAIEPTDCAIRTPRRPRQAGRVARRIAGFGITAAAALLAGLLLGRGSRPPVPPPEPRAWHTGPAEAATIPLPDGSVVRIGPESWLEAVGTRAVALEGVAYFAVTSDSTAPFEVRTRAGRIRVVGTRFEARAEGDSALVAVVEGRVALAGLAGRTVEIGPGQAGLLVAGVAPETAHLPPSRRLAAWMGRVLIFRDTPLSDVAAEIEAVYGIPLQLVSDAADEPRVSAVFEERPFDEVVATVCRVLGSPCEVTPDQATIYWTTGGR
ncbi:MAG: FecR domain-containing protein [Gemmatimonadota bacterium]|nr:MAG: FecR domain-containing protein [Gemmatimonadota bacterium]